MIGNIRILMTYVVVVVVEKAVVVWPTMLSINKFVKMEEDVEIYFFN